MAPVPSLQEEGSRARNSGRGGVPCGPPPARPYHPLPVSDGAPGTVPVRLQTPRMDLATTTADAPNGAKHDRRETALPYVDIDIYIYIYKKSNEHSSTH